MYIFRAATAAQSHAIETNTFFNVFLRYSMPIFNFKSEQNQNREKERMKEKSRNEEGIEFNLFGLVSLRNPFGVRRSASKSFAEWKTWKKALNAVRKSHAPKSVYFSISFAIFLHVEILSIRSGAGARAEGGKAAPLALKWSGEFSARSIGLKHERNVELCTHTAALAGSKSCVSKFRRLLTFAYPSCVEQLFSLSLRRRFLFFGSIFPSVLFRSVLFGLGVPARVQPTLLALVRRPVHAMLCTLTKLNFMDRLNILAWP